MTEQQKLDAIYEAMWWWIMEIQYIDKSAGRSPFLWKEVYMRYREPVRIGDVLDYDKSAMSYNVLIMWDEYRLPIDEQSGSCIDYVYSLIQK